MRHKAKKSGKEKIKAKLKKGPLLTTDPKHLTAYINKMTEAELKRHIIELSEVVAVFIDSE